MAAAAFEFESPWGHGRPLAGQTALVTGAGRGIGRGVAQELAAAGAYIVAADIDLPTAQQTIDELGSPGDAAQVDGADPASVDQLLGRLTRAGPPIDRLTNAA